MTATLPAVARGGLAGSPSTLTVNRPLVLLRLPMKNRAPCMDRVAGKGTSAVLKTVEEGFRATKEQLAEAVSVEKDRAAPPEGVMTGLGLGSLNNKLIPSQFWGPESKIDVLAGPSPAEGSRGGSSLPLPAPGSFRRALPYGRMAPVSGLVVTRLLL